MPQDFTDVKSTLVQVMAWCRQATSHYLNQCWPRSSMPYGVTRPQWVNTIMVAWLLMTWQSKETLSYRQVSNISRTKSQHLKDSRTALQLSLTNTLKPDVESKMKMQFEQRRQAMLQLHLSDRQFYWQLRCGLYQRFYGSSPGIFWPQHQNS